MPFHKVQTEKLSHSVIRQIELLILRGILRPGERLPSERELAERMQVSPQQISKIVSGNENLTIETQIKLQNILNIPILASFYENQGVESISMQPLNETYHMTNSVASAGIYLNPTQGLAQTMVVENTHYFLEFESAS